jgi:hypothetical protein
VRGARGNPRPYRDSSKIVLREVVIRGVDAGSRPNHLMGKADDTVEVTGESTRWYRRGKGSSIQEQTSGNNVGKLPGAAGTGNNLQGLSERGQKPKEERAQRERRMSQYERRRRGNSLLGDGPRLPNGGNTRVGQRGSGHLAVCGGSGSLNRISASLSGNSCRG